MRSFSRWMPPAPVESQQTPIGTKLLLGVIALLGLGLFAWALTSIAGRWIAVGVLLLTAVDNAIERIRVRRLVAARRGEDIGTFARAFNRRSEPFDPRVVRAVWDAVQAEIHSAKEILPLRPGDRLYKDLHIDHDDFELDVVPAVASRANRSLDECEKNPWFGRIETVGDLVRFFCLQPRRVAT
jgi:hypothetical protein